jgi:hypothetical protein
LPAADVALVIDRLKLAHGIQGDDHQEVIVKLTLTAGGPAFTLKGQGSAFTDVEATVQIVPQRVTFTGTDWAEEWSAPMLADAYRQLAHRRRRLRWTRRDVAAFGSAALWTYVSLPFLLAHGGVGVQQGGVLEHRGQRWDRLDLDFGEDVATHSRRQAVYVDEAGLIRRHDYVARAFRSSVTSAHFLDDYRQFSGIKMATYRHVHPRLGQRAFRRPTIVRIAVHTASLEAP